LDRAATAADVNPRQERVVNKRIVFNLLKYLLAFGLLGWVVWSNWEPPGGRGLSYVWQRHAIDGQPVAWGYLVAALVIYQAAVLLTLLRWYVLVRAQGLPFRLGDAIRLGLLGFFFSTFLPGSVGGDIVKAAALARVQSRRTVAVATVLMDRAIALWGLIWFVALLGAGFWLSGALEGPAAARAKWIVSAAGVIVASTTAVWLLLGLLPERRAERFAGRLTRLPKVGGSAAEFWRAVWLYRCRQGSVVLAMLLSCVGFVGFVLTFYCCAATLADGQPLPSVTQHFLLVPVGMVIMAVPLFPGGAGIGELGFGLLYGWFGYSRAAGILGSLVQRVLTWLLALLGYLVALGMSPGAPQKAEPVLLEGPGLRRAQTETSAAS
jgi:uncharacterized protein (TIRG00374 family)